MSLSTPEQQRLLNQLAHHYDLEPSQLRCLTDNPDDGVYGFIRQGQAFVLKYALPTVRTFAALQAQINWVNFLAEHGVLVSRPVPSQQGRWVEQLPFTSSFVAVVCYEHVPGERPAVPTLSAEQWQTWGQTLGKLHALSTRYTPHPQYTSLAHWDASAAHDRATIPVEQMHVLEKFDALQQTLQALPTDPQVYGVVHGDVQANNLCLDQGRLWVIDFDACGYHWFLLDIATSLYFTLWERPADQSNTTFAAFVLENLWAGYAREHVLDAEWLERLPLFLKLVEMNNYVAILEYNQVALRDDPAAVPPKHRALLNRYRDNIEHDVPYIESAYFPWGAVE